MNREAIYSALWAKVSGLSQFKVTSRRVRLWMDVPSVEQPALFMAQTGESARKMTRQPKVWTFNVELYIYVHTGEDMNTDPATLLNPCVDAVDTALKPASYGVEQTLGGLVERCSIEGGVETSEGALGPQAIAIIPVTIIVPVH